MLTLSSNIEQQKVDSTLVTTNSELEIYFKKMSCILVTGVRINS